MYHIYNSFLLLYINIPLSQLTYYYYYYHHHRKKKKKFFSPNHETNCINTIYYLHYLYFLSYFSTFTIAIYFSLPIIISIYDNNCYYNYLYLCVEIKIIFNIKVNYNHKNQYNCKFVE
jgi:hypothetical protein